MAYAMQFLRLPTEAIDAVLVDRSLCVLRTDAKILCAELEAHRKTEIPVDPYLPARTGSMEHLHA